MEFSKHHMFSIRLLWEVTIFLGVIWVGTFLYNSMFSFRMMSIFLYRSTFSWWIRFPYKSRSCVTFIRTNKWSDYWYIVLWLTFLLKSCILSNKIWSYQGQKLHLSYRAIVCSHLIIQQMCIQKVSKVLTFFARILWRLISNWLSRFCKSFILSPESSSPKICLLLLFAVVV